MVEKIESVVLRLASSDLDPDDAVSDRTEEIEKAKQLVKDSSERQNLTDGVGLAAGEHRSTDASRNISRIDGASFRLRGDFIDVSICV